MIHSSEGEIRSTAQTRWTKGKFTEEIGGGVREGVVVEGRVESTRAHNILGGGSTHRYTVVVVNVESARKRQFDGQGKELEVYVRKEKLVRPGYLFVKHVAQDDPNALTADQLRAHTSQGAAGALPSGLADDRASNLHPTKPGIFEFWGSSDVLRSLDLRRGDDVRIKTRGTGPWLDQVIRLNQANPNSVGQPTGQDWGTKILGMDTDDGRRDPRDSVEGAADDEWDD